MWLIFGGTGFLGSALCRLLGQRGIDYAAPTSRECDIRDATAVERWMEQVSPEVVVNSVAMTAVDECEAHPDVARAINTMGPTNMAKLCREKGTFFAHFSTDYVFSGNRRRPYRETDLTDPVNVYGWTKRMSEEAIQTIYPQGGLIIRTAWLFSSARKGFFTYLVGALREGRPELTVPRQEGSPTFVEDLAEATLNLIEGRRLGLFHVVNAGSATWKELADFFLTRFPGGEALKVRERAEDLRPARRPKYSVLAVDKLREVAGIDMRPWQAAVAECLDRMIKNVRN